jgi:3-oxoacyl-[acyl-carrier protein] reductase
MVGDRRTMLITGSRRGIGRAVARHYAECGDLVFGISRSESDFEHGNYRHLVADISDEAAVRAAVGRISAEAGRLDVLINNAGVRSSSYALLATASQAREMLGTNLLGAFVISREAIKVMRRRRFGRVISFSSVAVPLGSAGAALYGATKAGLAQLMYGLSVELSADDITCNTIGISSFEDSGMVAALNEAALRDAKQRLPKPAQLDISEIVHAIDFFASREAKNITGQVLYFGGVR